MSDDIIPYSVVARPNGSLVELFIEGPLQNKTSVVLSIEDASFLKAAIIAAIADAKRNKTKSMRKP